MQFKVRPPSCKKARTGVSPEVRETPRFFIVRIYGNTLQTGLFPSISALSSPFSKPTTLLEILLFYSWDQTLSKTVFV